MPTHTPEERRKATRSKTAASKERAKPKPDKIKTPHARESGRAKMLNAASAASLKRKAAAQVKENVSAASLRKRKAAVQKKLNTADSTRRANSNKAIARAQTTAPKQKPYTPTGTSTARKKTRAAAAASKTAAKKTAPKVKTGPAAARAKTRSAAAASKTAASEDIARYPRFSGATWTAPDRRATRRKAKASKTAAKKPKAAASKKKSEPKEKKDISATSFNRKEFQRMKDASPKKGWVLDRAVQRVDDLKATARAAEGQRVSYSIDTRWVPEGGKYPKENRAIERKKAMARAARARRKGSFGPVR